jgi:hypothetical protein
MKRLDLVRIIEQNGAVFIRHGSDHDWYKNTNSGFPGKPFRAYISHRPLDLFPGLPHTDYVAA